MRLFEVTPLYQTKNDTEQLNGEKTNKRNSFTIFSDLEQYCCGD